jgi:hypothetical protein
MDPAGPGGRARKSSKLPVRSRHRRVRPDLLAGLQRRGPAAARPCRVSMARRVC